MNYDVVIVASGQSKRAKLGYSKTLFKLKNKKTVLEAAASSFIEDDDCKNIIVVTNPDCFDLVFKNEKVKITAGGKERRDSTCNGLKLVESEYVLVHDAARPFLDKRAVEELKKKVEETGAAILGHFVVDTVKLVKDGKIEKTIDRKCTILAETPQGFKTDLLRSCYENCEDINFTDEASLVESLGYDVYVVVDKYNNAKLTIPEDFKNI